MFMFHCRISCGTYVIKYILACDGDRMAHDFSPVSLRILGKFDSCHHNSVKLGVTLKIMPLNGMDFNMTSNFKKL